MTKQDKKLFEHMFSVISAASKSNPASWESFKKDYEVVMGVDNDGSFRFFTIYRPSCKVSEFSYNDEFQRLAWASEVNHRETNLNARPTAWAWFRVEFWGNYDEFVWAFSKENVKKDLFDHCK